jgi:hypothetical protein
MNIQKDWQVCNSETFWCEVGSSSHVVQLYENDDALLSLLEDFVEGGVLAEDCVLIIATKEHLQALEQRLSSHGLDVEALRATDQYIAMDANETLSKFMLDGVPDRERFLKVVGSIFNRVRATGRKVRAFGEMVAILWEQGNASATIILEKYWNELFETEAFPLFCAYPKSKFPEGNDISLICQAHSKVIINVENTRFDLSYREVD